MKRETYLKGLLAFLLLMVGANTSWADDVVEVIQPSVDGWIRYSSNTASTFNSTDYEIKHYTKDATDNDFYAVMKFAIPNKMGMQIKSASLRMVTKKSAAKTSMAVYKLTDEVTTSSSYSTLTNIATDLAATALGTFTISQGERSKQLGTDNLTKEEFCSPISKWTNNISLTASNITMGSNLSIAIAITGDRDSGDGSVNKFFSSRATNITVRNADNSNTVTYAKGQLVPQLTIVYEPADGYMVISETAIADGYVRGDGTNGNTAYGTDPLQLVRKDDGAQMYGYTTFALTEQPGYELQSASLRLTAKRVKGDRYINIYALDGATTEAATYNSLSSVISNPGTAIVSNYSVLGNNTEMTVDIVPDDYSIISAWQNTFDLASYVSTVTADKFGLLFERANTSTGDEIHFFPHETTSITNTKDAKSTAFAGSLTAPDIQPRLVLVYKADDTSRNISVSEMSNGTVVPDVTTAKVGKIVTLTVTPTLGYKLSTLSATKSGSGTVTITDNKFVMPADGVTISATFEALPTYTVTPATGLENGSIAADVTSGVLTGATVTVTATPSDGYQVGTISVTNGSDAVTVTEISQTIYTFTMPSGNVNVTATFNQKKTPVLDTWVRSDNSDKYGGNATFEIKKDDTNSKYFYGLMVFDLTDKVADGKQVKTASLRLTTRVLRGDAGVSIYPFSLTNLTESDVNGGTAGVSDAIAEALTKTPITFTANGSTGNKAITDDGLATGYQNVAAWQNTIDISDIAKGMTTGKFAILLCQTESHNNQPTVFYTKEVGANADGSDTQKWHNNIATIGGTVISFKDLIPELTITEENLVTTAKTITVNDMPHYVQAGKTDKVTYAEDATKTVAYTDQNDGIWYLGDVDMSKVHSIDIIGAAFASQGNGTKAQLRLAYLPSGTTGKIEYVSAAEINANTSTIRHDNAKMARIEAETTAATELADGKNVTNYAGANFRIKASGVTKVSDGDATHTTTVLSEGTNTFGLQKTDGVYQLYLYGNAGSRRLAVDQVVINFVGATIPDGAYVDKTAKAVYYNTTGYDKLSEALAAVTEATATILVGKDFTNTDATATIASGKAITLQKAGSTTKTISGDGSSKIEVAGSLIFDGVTLSNMGLTLNGGTVTATNMAAPASPIPVTISGAPSTTTTYITGGTTANFVLMNNGYEFVADGTNLKVQAVATTAKTLVVKDRVNTGGATRTITEGSKVVAATNSDNSIWYLGDVDMTKVYSITVEGAAFVSNGDNKAQLRLGTLPAGTVSSITTDALSTNSSTIRNAANLMAQIVAQTTPTTVETGKDATNYPGANFIITTAGVSQTGAYDGAVDLDATNSKGLQKTDATYQLFLYGNASSRRLAVDKVIINYRGTSIPDGAYADKTVLAHPAMLHTQADIDRVKGNLGLSPIREAYSHLQASSYAQTSYTASPVQYLKRMDETNWGPNGTYGKNADFNNYTNAMKDANAAYQLALRYQLEGSTACANAAVAILNSWASTNQGLYKITGADWPNDIPDPNEYLILIQGHQFANAAELLRDYSGWAAADFTTFKTWMRSTFSDNAMLFLQNHHDHVGDKHYWLNWDLAALTSMLSVGILCDDKTLIDYAISYYKGTAITKSPSTSASEVGYYANAIPFIYSETGNIGLGQCQESGRDQGHSLLDVALLGAFCQMAKNLGTDGDDLFATDDYRALKMAEYVGKYNLGNDVTFTAYNPNTEYNHTTISAEGRGGVRPAWELFYRYARTNSKTTKWTQAWVEKLRAANAWGEGGAGDYGSNSNGFDQLGYGTLMYADPTNTDGQDAAINEADYAGYAIAHRGAVGDTYVRSDNADSKNGSAKQMEIRKNASADFTGLLSFKLPADAVGKVKKAQLRLVTKRIKNHSNINLYKFEDFDEAAANYSSVGAAVNTAKSSTLLAGFTPKGQYNMDVSSDAGKEDFGAAYKNLEAWTNRIDLTAFVQGLTTRMVNLAIGDAGSDDSNPVQFFTKEWDTALATATSGFETAASNLVPQLIVVYTSSGATKTFMVDGEGFDTLDEALEEVQDGGTITVTGNAALESRTISGSATARITFTKSVTIKGKTGNEVLTRGSSSTAMKQSVLFKANSGKTVTFDGIVFDDNNATVGQPFEVDNNTFVLKNITIKNSKSTSANGVISMKKGTLTVEGITFTDCAISNAYLRAAAGTLNFSGNYNLTNSTGNHFRLGNVALDATTLPAGITYKIEVEDAAATITNVSDASKFELTSDGYLKSYNSTTKVISFTEEGDGQDTAINEASYSGKTISKRGATGDTYVRSDNMTRKNGSVDQMEIRTNADGSNDFVGLISFKLPAAAIGNVTKAQLRLVTKQKKTNNRIRLYAVGEFDEKEATYETMSSAIAAARGISLLAKFKPKGEYNMDVTKDAGTMSDDSKNLSAWTNYIDLTSYLNSLTTADVNLMLTESEGDGKAIQFFTKERTDAMETSVEGNAFNAASADLVPQLIVVFAEDTSNRKAFYISGEGSYDTLAEAVEAAQDGDEIIVTKNASVSARVTFTKNVTLKAESGVVLSRSAEEAAMKQSVLFKANSGKTVTFDGIVFDDNNATVGQLFEVDNNTFVLKNMTIKNSKSTSANGVISMKKGTLTVEGITFTDCAISNAYLRAAAGTLNFSGNYNLTNSTGNHFRLGSVALNGGTLPAIQGTWRIEVESDGASITNVTDASKFTLASVGYTMSYANNTITFTAEGDGQDTSEIVVPEGYNKSLIDPIIDTYVRKGNASNNGQRMNMEVYTYQSEEEDLDFAGLMAFKLPDDLTKSGAKLEKAQLRLVTKRVKGSRIIDMYQIYTDFDEEAIYDQMEKRLTDAREGGYMRRFQAKGQAGMDIEADSLKLTDEYKDIKNWTNLIDLTDVVQNVMFDDGILRFALSAPVNGKDPKQFYTSEAETFKNAVMQVSYADLIPQLILVYSPGNGASTLTAQTQEAYPNIDLFLRKGSTSDNSSSEVMEVYTFNDGNQDQDFIGLMSFNLDNEVASARSVVRARSNSDLELFNATLRLVTKRLKGEREMNVFLFDTPFGANSTYSQLESAINEARTNGDYVTFKSAGMVDKDVVTDDGLTGDYSKTITAWTNYIDVTNLVKKSDRSTFNLMLSAPDNARTPKHYFSGDAESFTNTNYSNFIVSSDELVPLLTITYRNPLYTDIEETIVVPVKKEHIIYDLRGNRVQNAGKGIYIIDGKKVLKK